jgi:hypothetical protein
MKHSRFLSLLGAAGLTAATLLAVGPQAKADEYSTGKPSCANPGLLCAEVADPQAAFGSDQYVGHDEPADIFYSNLPGSGNHVQYQVQVPVEPSGSFSQTKGYDFALRPTFWFGMALCDTFSYPQQNTTTCTPDSDSNIVDPSQTTQAAGVAFSELQFYPPGWVPQFAAYSCDPTRWCVALTIDSLSENPIKGSVLNDTCQNEVLGGVEYTNFAYLTLDGKPLGSPNPLDFDPSVGGFPKTNGGKDTLFLNQGDQLTVTETDSPHGLVTTVKDLTTGQTGFMTASAANGFGQIKPAPTGTSCSVKPYDFHPMYSTSSPKTRVLWAAHSYNVAASDEIGHFDFCSHIDANSPTASCDGMEGPPGDREPADGDDNFCFASAESLKYRVNGCIDANDPGFDGPSYQKGYWPDGSATTPTPFLFTPPLTGSGVRYYKPYSKFALEADLPRIEAPDSGGDCDRTTGANCTNPPITDDGTPAAFYPYYSVVRTSLPQAQCAFGDGDTLPDTIDNLGGSSAQFGPLYQLTYWAFGGHGATVQRYNNFNSGPKPIPC